MTHQSLFVVRWGHTAPVSQVSDFPKRCARSSEGSLHVKPDSTARLTQSEVEHIKSKHPALAKTMRVIKKVAPPPVAAEEPKTESQASDASAASVPSGSTGKGRPKGEPKSEPKADPESKPST